MLRSISIVVLAGLLFATCKNNLQTIEETAAAYSPDTEVGSGVQMTYSEDGRTAMLLTAREVNRVETDDPYVEFPAGIYVQLIDSFGEVTGILTSKYAINYEYKSQTTFRDSVYLRNVRGEQLFTEELILEDDKDLIRSDKFVRIVTEDEQIIGHGLESNQDFTRYRILDITGTFAVEEDIVEEEPETDVAN